MDVQHVGPQSSLSDAADAFFGALARLERPGMEHLSSRYKPLTLLWALGRFACTGERLIPWPMFRDEVTVVLRRHGQWPDNPDPQYPFWDLTTSPFWEFASSSPNPRQPYSPRADWLDRHNPSAGFTADAANLLKDKRILAAAANALLERFFPAEDHEAILHEVRLRLEPSSRLARVTAEATAPAPPDRRLPDALLRLALERHAVAYATRYYETQNWHVDDVGAYESYDLQLAHRLDGRVRHVEVKGSSVGVSSVELTHAEVRHSRQDIPCDLFVVENITYDPASNPIRTWGGRARLWQDWQAEDADLEPTRFRYHLPPEHETAAEVDSGP
ncbi:protein NO VEIN domain-containing protein [Actinoplanes sp. CA-131856]